LPYRFYLYGYEYLSVVVRLIVFDGVYNPSDDSYLLLEAVKDKKKLKALDMGCGAGIIAINLAKQGCKVTAVDVNEKAIENTKVNAEINGVDIEVFKSDLFSNVKGRFELITFNPPYLPTEGEDVAWDGGREGIEVIRKFLKDAHKHLEENGEIYVVMSSLGNTKKIFDEFRKIYRFDKVLSKRFFFEEISVYRLTTFKNAKGNKQRNEV